MKHKKSVFDYVHLIIHLVNNLCLFLLCAALLLFSFAIIFALTHKEKTLVFIEQNIEQYLQNEFKDNADIDITNLKITGIDKSALLLTIEEADIKSTKSEENIYLKNLKFTINYHDLLKLRFAPQVVVERIDLKLDSTFKEESDLKNLKNFVKYLYYIKSSDVYIDELSIAINNSLSLGFKKVGLESSHNIIDFNKSWYKINASFFINRKFSSDVQGHCEMYLDEVKCNLSMASMRENFAEDIRKALPDFSKYIFISSSHFNSLKLDLTLKDWHLKGSKIYIDTDRTVLEMPFLFQKKKIVLDKILLDIAHDEHSISSKFNANLSENRTVAGEVKIKNDGTQVDITAENLTHKDISYYWPKQYLQDVSTWLSGAVKRANIEKVLVHVKTPMKNKDDLLVKVFFNDATLHYSSYLPDVTGAKGFTIVDNHDIVKVELEKGKAKGIVMGETKATYNVVSSAFSLDLVAQSELGNFINFFIVSDKLNKLFLETIKGEAAAELKFEAKLEGKEEKIFKSANFSGTMVVKGLKSPILISNEVSRFAFAKNRNSLSSSLRLINAANFNASCSNFAPVSNFKFDFLPDLVNSHVEINNLSLSGKGIEIAGNYKFSYLETEDPVEYVSMSRFKLCNNNFTGNLNLKEKIFDLTGKVLDIKDIKHLPITEFIKQTFLFLRKQKSEDVQVFDLKRYDVKIKLNDLRLFNNVKIHDLDILSSVDGISVKSDLINGYKNPSGIKFEVPNLGNLVYGFMEDAKEPMLENGSLLIEGNKEMKGKLLVKDYKLTLSGMDFSSDKLSSDFEISNKTLLIKNFKLQNLKNTLMLDGTMNLNNFNLDLDAIYATSALDMINKIPFFSDITNIISFGTAKGGLLTLRYHISGTPLYPNVEFKTYNTTKQLIINGVAITGTTLGINLLLLLLL